MKHKNLVALFLIIGVCFTVYFPSLFHIARSDQDNFFIETADINSLWDLIISTYSYNRWRIFDPGDEWSFKPLYFIFHSFGKWLYGYNFFYWQLTSLCLHIILVWQLYRILNLILPHILSIFVSLHFSIIFLIRDMVTWQHMSPCILLYIFLLKALEYCIKFIASQQKEDQYFWKIFIYMSLTCFIRETGIVYTFLIMAALYSHRKFFLEKASHAKHDLTNISKRINIGILSVPILVYLFLNILDYILRGAGGGLSVQVSGGSAFFQFILISLLCPFLPSYLKFRLPQFPQQRVVAESFRLRELVNNYIPNNFLSNLNLVLIVLLVGMLLMLLSIVFMLRKRLDARRTILARAGNKNRYVNNCFMGGVCFFCALLYCMAIYLTRFTAYGMLALAFNTYYLYPLVLFNTIIIYSQFSTLALYMKRKEIRYMTCFGIIVLSLSTILNGYYNYSFNVALKEHGEPILAERKAVGLKSFYLAKKYNGRGALRYRKGLNELALEDLKKAKIFNPNNEHVDFNTALVYMATDEPLRAAIHFTRTLGLKPNDKGIYVSRGAAYLKADRPKLALADFNQAIKIDPLYVRAYVYRSFTFYARQDFDHALKDAIKAKSLGYLWPEEYISGLYSRVDK